MRLGLRSQLVQYDGSLQVDGDGDGDGVGDGVGIGIGVGIGVGDGECVQVVHHSCLAGSQPVERAGFAQVPNKTHLPSADSA